MAPGARDSLACGGKPCTPVGRILVVGIVVVRISSFPTPARSRRPKPRARRKFSPGRGRREIELQEYEMYPGELDRAGDERNVAEVLRNALREADARRVRFRRGRSRQRAARRIFQGSTGDARNGRRASGRDARWSGRRGTSGRRRTGSAWDGCLGSDAGWDAGRSAPMLGRSMKD